MSPGLACVMWSSPLPLVLFQLFLVSMFCMNVSWSFTMNWLGGSLISRQKSSCLLLTMNSHHCWNSSSKLAMSPNVKIMYRFMTSIQALNWAIPSYVLSQTTTTIPTYTHSVFVPKRNTGNFLERPWLENLFESSIYIGRDNSVEWRI